MSDFNTTLLGKAVWNLIHSSNKLWVQVFRHKYLQHSSILSVPRRSNSSPIWKGILNARDKLKDGYGFSLGSGNSSVWYADWTWLGIIAEQLPFVFVSDTKLCLKDLVQNEQWNLSRLYTLLPENIRGLFSLLLALIVPHNDDIWCWNGSETVQYSVRKGYIWF